MLHIWYTNFVLPLFRQTHRQPLFSSFIRTNPYWWFSWLWEKINYKANAATVRERCRCCRWVVFKFFIFWCVSVFSLCTNAWSYIVRIATQYALSSGLGKNFIIWSMFRLQFVWGLIITHHKGIRFSTR